MSSQRRKTAYEKQMQNNQDFGDDIQLPADMELNDLLDDLDGEQVNDRVSALQRIKQMWDDFDLDEYMQTEGKRNMNSSTISLPVNDTNMKAQSDSPSWRHRLTVPEPFDMTIRDEINQKRKKEKLEGLLKDKRDQERMIEAQLEAKRKFRANPVPAHVYLPIYDELERSQEQRRQFVVENSQQLLRSLQKPFKFSVREHTSRSLQRCSSASDLKKPTPSTLFKANPVPESTNDPTITEQLREKDLYRKIQARMRAIELYRSAAAPPSMEARRRAQQELLADSLRQRSSSADRKAPAKVDKSVYSRLSRPKPKLPTSSKFIPQETTFNYFAADNVPSKGRPWTAAQSLTSGRKALRGDNAPPTRLTATSELRMTLMEKKLAAEKARIEQEEANRLKQYRRKQEISRSVQERALNEAPYLGTDPDKERERRQDLQNREKQYRRYLNEVEEKIANRPLLVERVTAEVARNQAAQKYREALERVGLTEKEVLESTTIAADFNSSNGYRYEHSPRSEAFHAPREKLDDTFEDLPASPIPPYSPEDDYAY